jgi:hypothetical protein
LWHCSIISFMLLNFPFFLLCKLYRLYGMLMCRINWVHLLRCYTTTVYKNHNKFPQQRAGYPLVPSYTSAKAPIYTPFELRQKAARASTVHHSRTWPSCQLNLRRPARSTIRRLWACSLLFLRWNWSMGQARALMFSRPSFSSSTLRASSFDWTCPLLQRRPPCTIQCKVQTFSLTAVLFFFA